MQSRLPMPSLQVHRHPDHTVLRLSGCDALDEYNSPAIGEQLASLASATPGERLLLDLEGIRYVSSTGLGALVACDRRVRAGGGCFALVNVGPLVREALAVTRLDQVLDILASDRLSA
jgi:anti-sigma B factor antagonist